LSHVAGVCGLGIGVHEGLPNGCRDHRMLTLRDVGERVANPMHAAALPGGAEDAADGVAQAVVGVGDDELDALQAASHQVALSSLSSLSVSPAPPLAGLSFVQPASRSSHWNEGGATLLSWRGPEWASPYDDPALPAPSWVGFFLLILYLPNPYTIGMMVVDRRSDHECVGSAWVLR
jgi:hypothetical protein